MDWKLAMKEERAALKRIVALLFALADLAQSSRSRSRLVRAFVLWVLRQAETVAWDFVIGAEVPPASMPVGSVGDGRADAMRLAQSFRDLARELDRQARSAFVVHDLAGQAGLAPLGAYRTLETNDFQNALRQVFAKIACRVAFGTGPPDTS